MQAFFEVHTFRRERGGSIVLDRVLQGPTEDETKQAAMALDPPVAGAVGVQIVRYEDGSVRTVTVFGYIGEVPEGYAAKLFDRLTEAP